MNEVRIDPDQFKRLTKTVNDAADATAKAYAPMLDAIRRDVAHLTAVVDAKPEPIPAPAVETVKLAVKRDSDGDLWISRDGENWTEVGNGWPLDDEFGPYTDARIEPLTT